MSYRDNLEAAIARAEAEHQRAEEVTKTKKSTPTKHRFDWSAVGSVLMVLMMLSFLSVAVVGMVSDCHDVTHEVEVAYVLCKKKLNNAVIDAKWKVQTTEVNQLVCYTREGIKYLENYSLQEIRDIQVP